MEEIGIQTYRPTEDMKVGENVYKTKIDGLLYINRSMHTDERGFFSEVVKVPELEEVTGKPFVVKQINHARSEQNVIRGIHAEGWNKYVCVISGTAFCVIADVRPESETFGEKEYFILGYAENALQGCLYLPSGIGNSVLVLDGPVDYLYLVDRLYKDRDPSGDTAISVFDPDLNIEWPIPKEEMIISERDKNTTTLRERSPEKFK